MVEKEKDLLEQVKILMGHKEDIHTEFHRDILRLGRNLDKGIVIRDLLNPILYITEKKDVRYYTQVLEPIKEVLKSGQLHPDNVENVDVYMGKATKRKEYISRVAGGFPTEINRDRYIIHGLYPDIDSTCIATGVILDIGMLMKENLEKNLIPVIERSLKYLFKKEFKNTGLLQQGPGEDWAPSAHRDGIVTYSNIMYLMLLEKSIDLFISGGEKAWLNIVREKMAHLVDSINKYLWFNRYYINGLNPYGVADLTYILDTIYLSLTKTFERDERLRKHIETLASTLTLKNGLLRLNTPLDYNEHVKKINRNEDINGGIWVPLNIIYAYTLINNNELLKGVTLLNKLIKYREYRWIDSETLKKGVKRARLINNSLILKAIDKVDDILKKEKLIEKL